MTAPNLGSIELALLALGAVVTSLTLNVYRRFRGTRLITCPETRAPAAVALDARRAALGAARGRTELRVARCSRWPERRACDQACVPEIERSPEACRVQTIVTRWYDGRRCVFCGGRIAGGRAHGHESALLATDGRTREWSAVAPESLPDVFTTDRPVCWNCHVAESFRREYPALVCDRPPRRSPPVRVAGA